MAIDVQKLSTFLVNRRKEEQKKQTLSTGTGLQQPVVTQQETVTPSQNNDTWFKAGAFDDGYQFGDIVKTILGTTGDVGVNALKGAGSLVEGVTDLLGYAGAGVADLLGADKFADDWKKNIQKNTVDEIFQPAEDYVDRASLLGERSDAISQGLGQVAAIILTGDVGSAARLGSAGVTALTTGVTGLSGMGSGMSQAYQEGATDGEAVAYGAIAGTAEALTEFIFAGMGKSIKALGFSKGVSSADDILAKKLSSRISSQLGKNLVELGVKAGEEGTEEVLSGVAQAFGKKLTYMSEEELGKLIKDERLFDQFLTGAITSGIAQSGVVPGMKAGSFIEATKAGQDMITGLTQNEQAVLDKVYADRVAAREKSGELSQKQKTEIYDKVLEDMENGRISTDTIESILGGDTYKGYQQTVERESKLKKEIEELENIADNVKQRERLAEARKELEGLDTKTAKSNLFSHVDKLTAKDTRLRESYNERTRSGQKFTADLTQYDEKMRPTIQRAIDNGEINNTRTTHAFIEGLAKIEAEKGIGFDFTNNKKLAELGLTVAGRNIGGYVDGRNVTLNLSSSEALNKVVGHEVTHIFEGTEQYEALSAAMKEFAAEKGIDWDARVQEMQERYQNVKNADPEKELLADLVGEYLFTDGDFVKSLSTKNPGLFKKIYEEIKYLAKTFAGTKQGTALEKVKKTFAEMYREGEIKNPTADGGVKYAILRNVVDVNGKEYSKVVKPGLTVYNSVKHKKKDYVSHLHKKIFKRTFDVNDSNGEQITIEFGKTGETVEKDGSKNPHPVLGELEETTDRLKMIAIINIKDLVKNSEPLTPNNENSHQWLDEGGWRDRISYMTDFDVVYPVILHVSKTRDGRHLLYDVSVLKKEGTSIDMDATALAAPSARAPETTEYGLQSAVEVLEPSGGTITQPKSEVNTKFSLSTDERKAQQLAIIMENNPMWDDYHVGIRSVEDIRTWEEVLELDEEREGQFVWGDFSREDAENALKNNSVTVYSSHPISNGTFVSTSYTQAWEYAGGNKNSKVYSKEVPLEDVAWINGDEGQYARVEEGKGVTYSVSSEGEMAAQDGWRVSGEDVALNEQAAVAEPGELSSDSQVAEQNGLPEDSEPVAESEQEKPDELYGPWRMKDSLDMRVEKLYRMMLREQISEEDYVAQLVKADRLYQKRGEQVETALERVRDAYSRNSASSADSDQMTIPPETETKMTRLTREAAQEIKKANFQNEINRVEKQRRQARADYDAEIEKVQAEYDSKKNKTTKAANDLLRRIERLHRMRDNVDADYAKRLGDLEDRLDRMNTPEYQRAVQRRRKLNEYTDLLKELVGDTSTWVDKKLGISYKVNTLRRNLRDIVRDASGKTDIARADAIYEELQGKYNQHEAELKRESRRLKAVFAELELNHAEDTYAHMLGEWRYNPESLMTEMELEEFYEANKDKIDTAKVDTAIEEARKLYEELFVRVNEVLKEHGMKELEYREGYFPHMNIPEQGWLAKLMNWKTADGEIPTSIAGLTEDFKPKKSWQSFDKRRKGDRTSYSLEQGLDMYIHGALDWIYHIGDIQKRRALENYIRYIHSDEGIKERIDAINASEELDTNEAQSQIDAVFAEADNPLNNFVTNLRAGTNTLANKKSENDRQMESDTNRKMYSVMTNLNSRINANMVVGSISSALTNFIPITQSWVEVSPVFTLKGMRDTFKSIMRDDGMVNRSDFLTNRLLNEEKLYKTGWDKVSDKAAFMMEAIDSFTSQTVWRSKYLQNIHEGMSEAQAMKNADQFAENVIAGRSRGNMPTIFDAKNPLTKLFTAFQLEVSNQYAYMFKDAPQDAVTKKRLIKGYAAAFIGAYAYNAIYSSLVGRDAAFDPISIFEDLFRDLGLFGDDEEEEPADTVLNLIDNILEEVPFVGGLLGGGRIPISPAIPYSGEYEGLEGFVRDVSDGDWESITKEVLSPLWYLALPMGGGQIKKTTEGLSMFLGDHPVAGSYTDSGNLRFPVEATAGNVAQAAVFGQYASQNARDYFDNRWAPLQGKQIQEFVALDIPIAKYRRIRNQLNKLTNLPAKVDFIDTLDLPVEKKNILVNNLVNRKDPIDMSNYDLYADFEEFDFSQKNEEKYAFLKSNEITYKQYNASEESRAAYNWAYQNPEKFEVSKAVADDLLEYREYSQALGEIKADKDSLGNAISGSRQKKVVQYLNSLDVEYGAKLVLYKMEYPKDNTYNDIIIRYVSGIEVLNYQQKVTILKELGFTVTDQGRVTWQ